MLTWINLQISRDSIRINNTLEDGREFVGSIVGRRDFVRMQNVQHRLYRTSVFALKSSLID